MNGHSNYTIEVEVTESIAKTLFVNAIDEPEAVEKAMEMYRRGDIDMDDVTEADVRIRSRGIAQKVLLFRSRAGDRPTVRMVI
jgi:hypothetical protein